MKELERIQNLEANYFAICLLLDEEMVRREVRRIAPDGFDIEDDPAIGLLAKRFGVSVQLMTIRLCMLDYFNFSAMRKFAR